MKGQKTKWIVVFTLEIMVFQSEIIVLQWEIRVFQTGMVVFQNAMLVFQSEIVVFHSESVVFQPERVAFQSERVSNVVLHEARQDQKKTKWWIKQKMHAQPQASSPCPQSPKHLAPVKICPKLYRQSDLANFLLLIDLFGAMALWAIVLKKFLGQLDLPRMVDKPPLVFQRCLLLMIR